MPYPAAVTDQTINHAAQVDDDGATEVRAAYSETVQAHSVIEIELTSGQSYLIHIEDVEVVLGELKGSLDAEGDPTVALGADIGSWSIKALDGSVVYGTLASEDSSGRAVCRLYQSQLDRLKALATPVFRDETSGAVLDAATTAAIA